MKTLLFNIGKFLILRNMSIGMEYIDFTNGITIRRDTETNTREFHRKIVEYQINQNFISLSSDCLHEPTRIESTVPYYQCKKCFKRMYNLEGSIPYVEAKGY